MQIKKESSRLVKPYYGTNSTIPPSSYCIPLSPFDKVTYDAHMAVIYAYKPPTPPTSTIELGLRIALAKYRDFAGRLIYDDLTGIPQSLLLNDEGVRFIEASSDDHKLLDLERDGFFDCPRPEHLDLHPPMDHGVAHELVQVQLTRFKCGSLVVGFTSHHVAADGFASSNFLVAWGRATRSLPVKSPSTSLDRSTMFIPRTPPHYQFDHRGNEYCVIPDMNSADNELHNHNQDHPHCKILETNSDLLLNKLQDDLDHGDEAPPVPPITVHKAHFSSEFLAQLKKQAAAAAIFFKEDDTNKAPFTTFECLIAHVWRQITRARGLDGDQTTQIRIAVNGRGRILNPKAHLGDYFGNLVLWAFPKCTAKDLLNNGSGSLGDVAMLIREAVAGVNDDYFRSFIDFSASLKKTAELVSTADAVKKVLCPNLEVHSWLRFPFSELDFGEGGPCVFLPSFMPYEGVLVVVPSLSGDGDVDVFVPLLERDVDAFQQSCYSQYLIFQP